MAKVTPDGSLNKQILEPPGISLGPSTDETPVSFNLSRFLFNIFNVNIQGDKGKFSLL